MATLEEYQQANPSFIGSKFIYGPVRNVDDSTFSDYMQNAKRLHVSESNFIFKMIFYELRF